MPTGAETIVATLEDAGVEVCFGLPGVHNLPLWEALRGSSIRLIGVRHEQAAVYAADGYARATGRLGVAAVTTGPGAANTAGAMGEAWASHSPVLLVATDVPTTLRRPGVHRGALHETPDQGAIFASITVERHRAPDPEALPGIVAEAVRAPLRRRGPAYLEVPTDLLTADGPGASPPDTASPAGDLAPDPDAVRRATELLERAERPLIWAGGGARDAAPELTALAERLAAPVLTTYAGRGVIAPSHPCAVGFPPHIPAAGALWDEADVVLAIGTDFDGMSTQNWAQPQPPRMVAVNVDPGDAAKNYRADVVVRADAAAGCAALAEALTPRVGIDGLRDRLRAVRVAACRDLDSEGMRFLDCVGHGLPADAIVLADMCIPGYWIAGLHPFAAARRLQYPVGWGTLGFAFPASLGAALAGRGPVVSFSGDGGFLFACGELATVAQERLPLTAVIIDDGGYGMLRHDQDVHGTERFGVDLQTPDFEALARSFGVHAETVDGLDDGFGEALARHVEDPAPSVLVSRGPALRPPPTTSPEWYRRRR